MIPLPFCLLSEKTIKKRDSKFLCCLFVHDDCKNRACEIALQKILLTVVHLLNAQPATRRNKLRITSANVPFEQATSEVVHLLPYCTVNLCTSIITVYSRCTQTIAHLLLCFNVTREILHNLLRHFRGHVSFHQLKLGRHLNFFNRTKCF